MNAPDDSAPRLPLPLLRALSLAAVGALMGFLLIAVLGATGGAMAALPVVLAAVFFAGTLFHHFLIESAGGAVNRMLAGPSLGTSPPDYSYADSLVARGHYDGAVVAYREAAEQAASPEPLLRAARVLRDRLGRYDEAVETLRAARSHPRADPGVEELVTREIVEILVTRAHEPARALPELARLADRHPDTQGGAWARRRMAELRQELWETVKDDTGEGRSPGVSDTTG